MYDQVYIMTMMITLLGNAVKRRVYALSKDLDEVGFQGAQFCAAGWSAYKTGFTTVLGSNQAQGGMPSFTC